MHRTFISSAGRIVLSAALCAVATPGAAQEPEAPAPPAPSAAPSRGPALGLVFELGADYGGEAVATVTYEDGSYQEITGGEGITVGIGGKIRPSAASPFAVRATVGYKYNPSNATNARIALSRVPLRLIASYDVSRSMWVGGGVVRHSAVRFDGDGVGPDMEFEDANGALVELGWESLAVSYTSIRYTDEAGAEFDASHIGLTVTVTLGGGRK